MTMWYDALVSWLLRSPLHGILSRGFMLVTVIGRLTGRRYTTPVNYVRDSEILWVISTRRRTWWRNLIGGAPVRLLLDGRDRFGRGEALVDEKTVADNLMAYFQKFPRNAKYFGVGIGPSGRPVPEDCARVAKERVMIRVGLVSEPAQPADGRG